MGGGLQKSSPHAPVGKTIVIKERVGWKYTPAPAFWKVPMGEGGTSG